TWLTVGGARLGRGARLAETDPGRGPVDEEDLADEVASRNRPPDAGIAGLGPVVAHEEVVIRSDPRPAPGRLVVAAVGSEIRLVSELPLDVGVAVALPLDLSRPAAV